MNIPLVSRMKNLIPFFLIVTIIACNDQTNTPDVSGIKVDLKVERFEQAFLASTVTIQKPVWRRCNRSTRNFCHCL